jgi:beta-phosphoglucomutase-like phosphatase (HAD superfamily)
MGFNRRKMEHQRREAAEKEAASRRATDAQVLEDAEELIAAWNERQAKRMPMLFSPTIGAASQQGIGFCGCVVRRAERSTQSTCARWTVIPTRQ